jgi:hypothetical protein
MFLSGDNPDRFSLNGAFHLLGNIRTNGIPIKPVAALIR